ncbi:MAG: hypothetical protein BRC28_01960 [Nanohaloarchaea archaeon SW_4_43_9]|nr:MAG: hypothetical protein BRC28_01960 [Nanohaloarchaea archaeon SW_4_43_9]
MENRKTILTIFLALFLVANVGAQDPRHPLSQIYPIDIDLGMEAQDIRNVSQLQLNDGVGEKGKR